jgi:hypothetical protein
MKVGATVYVPYSQGGPPLTYTVSMDMSVNENAVGLSITPCNVCAWCGWIKFPSIQSTFQTIDVVSIANGFPEGGNYVIIQEKYNSSTGIVAIHCHGSLKSGSPFGSSMAGPDISGPSGGDGVWYWAELYAPNANQQIAGDFGQLKLYKVVSGVVTFVGISKLPYDATNMTASLQWQYTSIGRCDGHSGANPTTFCLYSASFTTTNGFFGGP